MVGTGTGRSRGGRRLARARAGSLPMVPVDSPGDAAVYWISQLAGGVTGAALLTLVFDPATRQAVNLGTPGLGAGISVPQGLVFEIVATFFLVLVVCATAIDERGAYTVVSGLPIGFVGAALVDGGRAEDR